MGNGDLTAIFEKRTLTSFTPDRVISKVLRVHEILEEIDITHFIVEAGNISQSSQHAGSKPIFAVVAKPPCLAVKYPRGNTVRRIQIKFTFDPDYYTALSILREIGCPVSEPSVGYMRKLTSLQWNSESIEATSIARGPSYGSSMSGPFMPVGASAIQRPSTTRTSNSSSSITAFNSMPSTSWSTAQTSDATCISASRDQDILATARTPLQNAPVIDPEDVRNRNKNTARPFTSSAAEHPPSLETLPPRRVLPWASTAKRANTMTQAPPAFSHASVTDGISTNIDENAKAKKTSHLMRKNHCAPTIPTLTSLTRRPYNQPPGLLTAIPQFNPPYPPGNTNSQAERADANKSPAGKQGEAHQGKIFDALTAADLSSYMSTPTEERMTRLETWVCSQLEDDGFLELCRDVEGIWQRIAFGR
ncbi:hypothetical protein AbraCBS73388_002459 [Aspergillus brasiliensis]|uniref:Uncharacterized protein n=1 Tax=Aspergillus brasiliensis TaxID=319629 RepID=A0A9W6DSQ9_9EURO|nr:hypothetical protein AbraCBS73388_002459 [Aspergillus brasiliensis]